MKNSRDFTLGEIESMILREPNPREFQTAMEQVQYLRLWLEASRKRQEEYRVSKEIKERSREAAFKPSRKELEKAAREAFDSCVLVAD